MNLVAQAIVDYWGERCPDYDVDCFCCKAWEQFDIMHEATAMLATRHQNSAKGFRKSGERCDTDGMFAHGVGQYRQEHKHAGIARRYLLALIGDK